MTHPTVTARGPVRRLVGAGWRTIGRALRLGGRTAAAALCLAWAAVVIWMTAWRLRGRRRTGAAWLAALAAAGASASAAAQQGYDPWSDRSAMTRQATSGERFSAYDDLEADEPGFQWSDLAPEKTAAWLEQQYKAAIGRGRNPDAARQLFAQAEQLYREAAAAPAEERAARFSAAGNRFQSAAERWERSSLEEDALFFAGECFFFADHYEDANEAFEQLVARYPQTRRLDAVEARRFALAQYWIELEQERPMGWYEFNLFDERRPMRDQFGSAVRVFDRIQLEDPTGKLADDAVLAAGNAHFAAGNYLDADDYYTDLRRTFPGSEHQFRAHLLGVKAKLLSYQGADYDGDALDGAEQLVGQVRRQFRGEAEEHREQLTRAAAEVRFRKAEREWTLGQYYDRRREYGGARFHYETLIREYADTDFAKRAEARLPEIAGLPDTPPPPLRWLSSWFEDYDDTAELLAQPPGG